MSDLTCSGSGGCPINFLLFSMPARPEGQRFTFKGICLKLDLRPLLEETSDYVTINTSERESALNLSCKVIYLIQLECSREGGSFDE
jgi:hypothetical protein